MVMMEVLTGCRDEPEYQLVRGTLRSVERLEMTEETWESATWLGFSLRRKGLSVRAPDLIIAACAIEHSAVLVHADSDFDLIAQHTELQVESYAGAS